MPQIPKTICDAMKTHYTKSYHKKLFYSSYICLVTIIAKVIIGNNESPCMMETVETCFFTNMLWNYILLYYDYVFMHVCECSLFRFSLKYIIVINLEIIPRDKRDFFLFNILRYVCLLRTNIKSGFLIFIFWNFLERLRLERMKDLRMNL